MNEVIVPLITHVKLSDKQRKRYYIMDKREPTAKKFEDERYFYDKVGKDKDWYLYDKKDVDKKGNPKKVIANPESYGKPRLMKINGNAIYSGNMSHHVRNKVVTEMKKHYKPHIQRLEPVNKSDYPIRVWIDFNGHTQPKHARDGDWDIDNQWIHSKVIMDCLTECGIIIDDSIRFVSAAPYLRFFSIREERSPYLKVQVLGKGDKVICTGANYSFIQSGEEWKKIQ